MTLKKCGITSGHFHLKKTQQFISFKAFQHGKCTTVKHFISIKGYTRYTLTINTQNLRAISGNGNISTKYVKTRNTSEDSFVVTRDLFAIKRKTRDFRLRMNVA